MTSSSNQSSGIIGIASLTWTISNYFNTNVLIWSQKFHPLNKKNINFSLGIFPSTAQGTNDELVYLWHNQSEKILNLEYDVSILKSDDEKGYTKKFYWNYDKDKALYEHCRNVTFLISKQKLMEYGFIQNNKLTLHCEIILHASQVSPNKQEIPENTEANKDAVLKDYESLLENGKLSDVVLVVSKKEFHVHKLILSARSPVFCAMFEHTETKEAQEGRVTITDVSVEVCEELLRYIYSGKIEQLKEYALDLFVVADKYQLKHLKSICEQSLTANITSESVINVLIFADMHNAQDLKQKCIDYVTKNSVEVRKSDSWKQLCKSKPELLIDLYADISEKAKF